MEVVYRSTGAFVTEQESNEEFDVRIATLLLLQHKFTPLHILRLALNMAAKAPVGSECREGFTVTSGVIHLIRNHCHSLKSSYRILYTVKPRYFLDLDEI